MVKLKAFSKFENTAEALQAAASLVDSKLSKGALLLTGCQDALHGGTSASAPAATGAAALHAAGSAKQRYAAAACQLPLLLPLCALLLTGSVPSSSACCPSLPHTAGLKKFLKKHAEGDTLAVLDAKLGSVIKEKLGINCLYSAGEGCDGGCGLLAPCWCWHQVAPCLFGAGGQPSGMLLHDRRSIAGHPLGIHPPRPSLSPTPPRRPLLSPGVMELTRGIRNQLTSLVAGLSQQDLRPMSLGLSHSLSRYKLKFSPDKVDTMIVQVRPRGGR